MPPPLPYSDYSPPKSNTARNVVIGCSVAFGIFLLIGAIGIYIVFANIKTIGAELVGAALTAAINESPLPAEQKGRLVARINQIKDDFKSDKISGQQMEALLQALTQSPVLPAGAAIFAEEMYLKPSGLSDAEKQVGRRSIQRVVRGAIDKSISEATLDQVMAPLSEPDTSNRGNTKLKQKVSDAELRDFLQRAKTAADDARVPDEDFNVNLADEFDKVIDSVLKPGPEPGR